MKIVKYGDKTHCTDCKQFNNCICFPDDEYVELEYRHIIRQTKKATLYLLKKQKLSTGKMIKTGVEIWFPNWLTIQGYTILKKVKVIGHLINQMVNEKL